MPDAHVLLHIFPHRVGANSLSSCADEEQAKAGPAPDGTEAAEAAAHEYRQARNEALKAAQRSHLARLQVQSLHKFIHGYLYMGAPGWSSFMQLLQQSMPSGLKQISHKGMKELTVIGSARSLNAATCPGSSTLRAGSALPLQGLAALQPRVQGWLGRNPEASVCIVATDSNGHADSSGQLPARVDEAARCGIQCRAA